MQGWDLGAFLWGRTVQGSSPGRVFPSPCLPVPVPSQAGRTGSARQAGHIPATVVLLGGPQGRARLRYLSIQQAINLN